MTDVHGAESPIAQQIFQERTLSAHIQGKSLLARIALAEAVEKPVRDDSGVTRDVLPQFTVDSNRMYQTFEFLVRGLRYSIDRLRYREQTEFMTRRLLFDEHIQGTMEALKGIRLTGPIKIGEGVFECHDAIAEDEPNGSIWLLCFYERVVYRVATRLKKL